MVLTRKKSEEKLEKLVQLGEDGKTAVNAKIPTLKIPTLYDSGDEDDTPAPAPTATAAPAPAPTIAAVTKKAFVVGGPPAPAPMAATAPGIVAKKSLGDKIKSFLFVVVVLALLFGFLIPELKGAFDKANVTPAKDEALLDAVDEALLDAVDEL